MMIHAYHEIYLNKAMSNLGEMFDFAINDFGLDRKDYAEMFAASSICRRLENGEPKYLVGMSGTELALDIIEETTGVVSVGTIDDQYDRTPDHWCGWAVCYYQWLTTMKYREIFRIASYDEISAMYPALHETDVTKFAEEMEKRRANLLPETNLKRIRTAYGCSQSELARLSGVSLRSIQMYEQRNKDINRAQAESLGMIARALGCKIEDLLEKAV
jgi:DNA-binding transcriptional regulator YiaG